MNSKDSLIELLSSLKEVNEINLSEIPYIDLYMDQVTTLFNDKLKSLKRNDNDVVLTKTMINNYAKSRILPPIKNKKYSKMQIILLILIYNLKQILSLDDIKLLFTPLLEKLAQEKDGLILDDLYDQFINDKIEQQNSIIDQLIETVRANDNFNNDDIKFSLLTEVLLLVNAANIQKRAAEKIIDTYFKTDK
ncbi:DUF1836 domain-containing protein [Clostridium oryzae]|uniref:DUF1836 domain-containing protein n=1 Tax=Clostridium oryzae TaxID=1450648 RepID=A0A1V4ITB2_9CLOT|nr:DUF1836 domain-containing protein [Clostridium oryzae]OPJ63035.1 hypothetical protein CLORY_14010 [Clostridium oryzae]